MAWTLTERLEEFDAAAGTFLRANPARNTVLLSILAELAASGSRAYGDAAPFFGWWAPSGEVTAACLRTPPHPLLVTGVDQAAATALALHIGGSAQAAAAVEVVAGGSVGVAGAAGAVVAGGTAAGGTGGLARKAGTAVAWSVGDLPGVNGREDEAAVFAAAWLAPSGGQPQVRRRLRLYRLEELVPPAPWPVGASRRVSPADAEQVTGWYHAFAAEVGDGEPSASVIDGKLRDGRAVLWELPDGTPVAMAGMNRTIAGVARVGPVYTPAEHRGRGYGSAATAVITQAALDGGATEVVLFTDLANPVSNSIYQRLGYRPVEDQISLAFPA